VPEPLEAELPLMLEVVPAGPEPAVSALVVPEEPVAALPLPAALLPEPVPEVPEGPVVEPVAPELVFGSVLGPPLVDPVADEPGDPAMVASIMLRRERQSALADVMLAPTASRAAEHVRNLMEFPFDFVPARRPRPRIGAP
jgi:hypothetical protein